MQDQTSTFEAYLLGLFAVLERLPMPLAVAFDRECAHMQENGALRRLVGTQGYRCMVGERELPPDQLPLRQAAHGAEVLDLRMQLLARNGDSFDVTASAWPLRGTSGHIEGAICVYADIRDGQEAEVRAQRALEALVESERRYRLITEAMPEFVWLDAPDGSALYSNRRWLDYTGLNEEQNEGFGWENVVHPEDAARLDAERKRTLETGETYEGECRYRGRDGKYRWFLFRSIAVRDEDGTITSWLGTATDIDKQKRSEEQQAFFALASDVLGSTLDVSDTLNRIARLAIASLGTWCQIDIPDASSKLRVAVVAHQDPAKESALRELLDQRVYDPHADFGPPAVLRTRKPQLLKHVSETAVARVIPNPTHRRCYTRAGYAAGLMVPLLARERVLGVLGIATDDTTRLYTDVDVASALELGRRGAVALENAQSFAREHRVAARLQRALLPSSLPDVPRLRFYAAYAPEASAQGEAVGGDWYDAFAHEDGAIAISVGDVAGHGIEAAVTMSIVRQAIRAATVEGRTPGEVLASANRMLMLESRPTMTTALCAVYQTQSQRLTLAVAGHPQPIAVDTTGALIALGHPGPPLGDAFSADLIEESAIALAVGTAVVFYTDGLVEYDRDLTHAQARLEDVLSRRRFLAAENPAQALIDAVLDAPQRDDIAVLVMCVDGPP